MSILPTSISSVPNLLQGSVASHQINSTQTQLLQLETELSTGMQINTPSDNPSAASLIEQLNRTLTTSQAYSDNINSATGQLADTDSTLGDLTTLLQQAQQIASANVGSDVSASQRQSAAAVVQSLYSEALANANTQFNGAYLFNGTGGNQQPFVEANGGVQFMGTTTTLQNAVGAGTLVPIEANGANVFGALSTEVQGTANLTPSLTAQTRIGDVSGALGGGITLGPIQISNGVTTQTVDLSGDQSIGDVINSINQAGVGGITAAISGQGLQITGAPGDNITITDIGSGTSAASLGIATSTGGAGVGNPVNGSSIQPKVTGLTQLSSLNNGAGIDNTGLTITNGLTTKTITWSAGGNVQDMLNAINGAGVGVQAEINSTGTGINILNATQGISMSISEAGGQTAADLGVQSFSASTALSQLNSGQGVQTAGGATPDFQITLANGTNFSVALGSAQTVQDVINDINSAATTAGGGLTASFNSTSNGILLTDTTGGGGTLSVTPLNDSTAASQLGLNAAASGNVIQGTDVNKIQSEGIFSDLQQLMTGLQTNNQDMITASGTALSTDTNNVIGIHGQVGAVEQQLTQMQTSQQQQNTATQTLLSQLQDTNYAQAVTQYQTLQQALQASLQTTANSLQLTLLNYLY